MSIAQINNQNLPIYYKVYTGSIGSSWIIKHRCSLTIRNFPAVLFSVE